MRPGPSHSPPWRALLCLVCTWLALACAHGQTVRPDEAIPPVEARKRPVTQSDALVAFARVYGYVRFFHPTDAAATADWSGLAAQGAQKMRGVKTLGDLDDRLEAFFRPLAPTLQLWVEGEGPPSKLPVWEGAHRDLVYWQYQGYPGATFSLFTPPYGKRRVGADGRKGRRFSQMPARDARVDEEVLAGLRVRMPIVLHRDEAEAAAAGRRPPGLDARVGALAGSSKGHDDPSVRLGAVIEVWNVLRHFYPYQQEVHVDWEGELRTALEEIEDGELAEASGTLRRLVAALRDGHGDAGHARDKDGAHLPVAVALVEGRPVVVGTQAPDQFRLGDVIDSIGGEPAADRLREIEGELSGSPQWRRFKAASWELPKGPRGADVEVVVRRDGRLVTVPSRYEEPRPVLMHRPPKIHSFGDGVMYVDLSRAEWDEIKPELPALAAAPGVVFDMRGYPTDTHPIIDHLLDAQEDARWMHVPRYVEPGGEAVAWHDIGWHRAPAEPQIGGEVVFLTSAAAISYGESMMSYVEAHDLGTRVGETTAGTNGDIVRLDVAGGFYVIFSGMRVTRHDGAPFHLRGVRPDIEVKPTLAGVSDGRDEVLEAGLRAARHRTRAPSVRTASP